VRLSRRNIRLGALLLFVFLPLWASLAEAQQQPGTNTNSPATAQPSPAVLTPPPPITTPGIPSLYSLPFGSDHLFGDWGGARTWLEDHGIEVGLNYFSETAAIVSGGLEHGIDYTSQIGLSIDLDGGKLFNLPGFALHSVIVQRNGRSASADFLDDDLDAVQQIFGGGGDVLAHLVYLYGEQTLDRGRVDLAGGWLPVGTYFASSPLYCEFMNVIYCGNPHPLPVYPGEPDWPAATWGGQARVFLFPTFYAMGGLFQVNPNNGGASGWNLFEHGSTGLSVPLEFGWVPSFGRSGLLGHYKFGFDEDTSSYPDLFLGSNGEPIAVSGEPGASRNGRRMYYVLVDQMLVRNGEGDTNGLILFGGGVHADRDTSPLENQVFGGVSETASFLGRPQDLLGFAVSWFQVSGELTATQQLEQTFGLPLTGGGLGTPVDVQTHEETLEAMYTASVYRGVSLMPDIQYVIHPGGTSHVPNALSLGLQANVTF
jgi:porin